MCGSGGGAVVGAQSRRLMAPGLTTAESDRAAQGEREGDLGYEGT